MVVQPRRARPVKARAGFGAVAGLQKPCPPTGPDQHDVATFHGDALRARRLVQFGGRDRVTELAEGLHTAQAHDVEQHTAGRDALAVHLVDAAVERAEAGHRIRREAVVQLVLVVDVG